MHSVVDAVLALLYLGLGGAADTDYCNAAGEFGQPLLQFFLVVVGGGLLDLRLDLIDARLDVGLLAGAVDDRGVLLVDHHLLGLVHTITFDNGKEFAAHQDIAQALKAKIFFATPYHAWERGLNENTNGLIRDFFPKGTDFSTIANAEVAKVERLLNARPRKSLGFRSPQEVFDSLAHS